MNQEMLCGLPRASSPTQQSTEKRIVKTTQETGQWPVPAVVARRENPSATYQPNHPTVWSITTHNQIVKPSKAIRIGKIQEIAKKW